MKETKHTGMIERGRIIAVADNLYTVASLDRSGIEIPGLPSQTGVAFNIGDLVHYVSFADGTGWIICGLISSLPNPSGPAGEDGIVLRIDSSRGNVFKNNAVSTVLTVTIHAGKDRITNISQLRTRYGYAAHLKWYWRRLEDDTYHEILSTDSKLSDDGFTLTLTPEDVDVKVTFICEMDTGGLT